MYKLPVYTGFQQVDEQHRTLFQIFNTLVEDLEATPGSSAFSDIFVRFGIELVLHTNTEEMLMKTLPMPKRSFDEHHEEHLEIIESYTNLNLALMNNLFVERQSAISMMHNWVVEHMLRYDAELTSYNWESP